MRSKEELNELKTAYESLTAKLQELTEDELSIVTGGVCPEEHNIMLTGALSGNIANGSGGGVYNEGNFKLQTYRKEIGSSVAGDGSI